MLFLESDFSVRILSVQKLSWKYNDTPVRPRPYNAISVRLKGNAYFSNGEHTVHLTDNDILFMPEGVGYHLKSLEEEIIVIHFELNGPKQTEFEIITPKHTEIYNRLFHKLYEVWEHREQGYYLTAVSILYSLFAMLSSHLPYKVNPSFSKIKKAVEYLNSNFADPNISLSTLCALTGFSDTYFRKLFFEIYGTTPVKYITKQRIDYAIELIETGYYSIEDISEKCGFEDVKYFSTVFKKSIGCSPSQYITQSKLQL